MRDVKYFSAYSLTGKWDDHVEFEYVRYYAVKFDKVEVDGRTQSAKRYAYELPDGRWLCGIRPRDRDNDKVALQEPRWLDKPDFEPTKVDASDRFQSYIGHYYRGHDHHLYVVVDMFNFGSPGYDAVIDVVEADPAGRSEDARFRWISAAAINRTFHHSRRCPCVAHLEHPYGAR
jgi:hypothetical protein